MFIAVTGSSGTLGRATVDRLRADGHDVIGFDLAGTPGPGFTRVDLADYGQTLDAMLGVTARHEGLDAVVHLAAVPVNGLVPDVTTFENNLAATYHVLFAAHRAGIRTVVFASSITAMGFPFEVAPPSLRSTRPTRAPSTRTDSAKWPRRPSPRNSQGGTRSPPSPRCDSRTSSRRTRTARSSGRATPSTAAICSARGSTPATEPQRSPSR